MRASQNNDVTIVNTVGRGGSFAGAVGLLLGVVGAPLSFIPLLGVFAWFCVIPGILVSVCARITDRLSGSALAGIVLNGLGLLICCLWVAALRGAHGS